MSKNRFLPIYFKLEKGSGSRGCSLTKIGDGGTISTAEFGWGTSPGQWNLNKCVKTIFYPFISSLQRPQSPGDVSQPESAMGEQLPWPNSGGEYLRGSGTWIKCVKIRIFTHLFQVGIGPWVPGMLFNRNWQQGNGFHSRIRMENISRTM